jgi:hypothetical protein
MLRSANVGSFDRTIRLVAGFILIILPFLSSSAFLSGPIMTWFVMAVGLILIATAILRFCPLYRVLGVQTCKSV